MSIAQTHCKVKVSGEMIDEMLQEPGAESFYELRRDFIISKNTGKRRRVS